MNVDLPSCIAGSKRAWDDFVRASAPVIYAAVRRSLRTRGIADSDTSDRVQDVYVRLLRDDCRLLRMFDPTRASLVTWLTLIARTVVHEHARRKSLPIARLEGQDATLLQSTRSTTPSPNEAADASLFHLPMKLLTEQQRQVIEMLFQQGLSVEAAAVQLGVEAQTIRSAKYKALTRLRQALGAHVTGSHDPVHARGCSPPQHATTKETDDAPRRFQQPES